jgi:membrane protease YdiL (CAAX protease family)
LPSSNRIIALALAIYLPLAAIGVAWARVGQGRSVWSLQQPWLSSPLVARTAASLALGMTLAVAVVLATPVLLERAQWARALHRELEPIVAPLSRLEVVVLALTSGLAEEVLFRGAMQPAVGLFITSLIFGAVHTGPKRVFVAWSLWAFVMGLAFGLIFELTGVLWGPILAHVMINERNMTYMKGH